VISQTVVKLGSAKNERVSRFKRVFLNPGKELQVRPLSNKDPQHLVCSRNQNADPTERGRINQVA